MVIKRQIMSFVFNLPVQNDNLSKLSQGNNTCEFKRKKPKYALTIILITKLLI